MTFLGIINIIIALAVLVSFGYLVYISLKNKKSKKKSNAVTAPQYYGDEVAEKSSYEDETPSLKDVKRVLKHIRK